MSACTLVHCSAVAASVCVRTHLCVQTRENNNNNEIVAALFTVHRRRHRRRRQYRQYNAYYKPMTMCVCVCYTMQQRCTALR